MVIKKTLKTVNKAKQKLTGKEKENELKEYFLIFEEILSGMDSRLTENKKEYEELRKKFSSVRDELQSEIKSLSSQDKNDISHSKQNNNLLYTALLLSLLALGLAGYALIISY